MRLETILQIATLLSVIGGLIGFLITVRSYQRQLNAQLFATFCERYEKIMSGFPTSARLAAARSSGDVVIAPSEELSLSVLRYLNLCSEEFYLWRSRYLDRRLWAIWDGELRRTLGAPVFAREWSTLSREFESYPEFRAYVSKIVEAGVRTA